MTCSHLDADLPQMSSFFTLNITCVSRMSAPLLYRITHKRTCQSALSDIASGQDDCKTTRCSSNTPFYRNTELGYRIVIFVLESPAPVHGT